MEEKEEPSSISALPGTPAIYAMCGGRGNRTYVAYVGVADDLKARVRQHLVRRDSSVATGSSAVGLNPDYVTEVRWWVHPDFGKRYVLEAAELVALEVLDPALRSRGTISEKARKLHAEKSFREEMRSLLQGKAAGRLVVPNLLDALERITQLEQRVAELEKRSKER